MDRHAVLVNDLDGRALRPVTGIDNDLGRVTRLFVDSFFEGKVRNEIAIANATGLLRDDHGVVRIPVIEHVALLDRLTVLHLELRTVDHIVLRNDTVGSWLDDVDHTGARDNNVDVLRIARIRYKSDTVELNSTIELGDNSTLRHRKRSGTTSVERTKCKLRTRLTDGLRSDRTDGFTSVHHLACGHVAAVATSTNTAT